MVKRDNVATVYVGFEDKKNLRFRSSLDFQATSETLRFYILHIYNTPTKQQSQPPIDIDIGLLRPVTITSIQPQE